MSQKIQLAFQILAFTFLAFAGSAHASTSSEKLTREQKLAALEYYLENIKLTPAGVSWPTIGFELEGVIPGRDREDAFSRLYDVIKGEIVPKLYAGRGVLLENYNFETRRGEPRQGTRLKVQGLKSEKDVEWHVKDDGSIVPPEGYIGMELVSPVLRSRREIRWSYGWVVALSKNGLIPEPNSAAFQVHAGFTDNGPLETDVVTAPSTVAETMLMMWIFSKIDKELMALYGTSEGRKKFTMPTPQEVIEVIEAGHVDVNNTVLSQFLDHHFEYRYWSLNFKALFQFGTVELRVANSTTSVAEIDSLVDLIGTLTQAVRSKNPQLVELMKKHIDRDIPVRELAEVLDLKLGRRLCSDLLGGE